MCETKKKTKTDNRPVSYSWYWTGTSLQLRLMQQVFSKPNGINLFLMIFPHMSLDVKLVPVQYREYKNYLFTSHFFFTVTL